MHVTLKLMDRRCLRSAHDVEGDGLVPVAAEASDFEISVAGIERRRLFIICRSLKFRQRNLKLVQS
jgi:hypothetical protein